MEVQGADPIPEGGWNEMEREGVRPEPKRVMEVEPPTGTSAGEREAMEGR